MTTKYTLYAHVPGGKGPVRAIERVPEGSVLGEDIFTPEHAEELFPCDDNVTEGMIFDGVGYSESEVKPWKRKDLLEWVRGQRDQLLLGCDWSQLPDADLTEAQLEKWRQYRKALRDLPASQNVKDAKQPGEVQFPTAP